MRFLLPGETDWREGTLVLENGTLYFSTGGLKTHTLTLRWISRIGKRSKGDYSIPLSSIKDVLREDGILRIKHTRKSEMDTVEVKLTGEEQVLNDVERELVLKLDAARFNIYFTHAGEGGVLSLEKNIELEKGLLKISNDALWIIGRDSHKRIGWDEIVNVEQKKRSIYKGTEYSAISIDYFNDKGNQVVSSIVITRGNTMDILKRRVTELLNAYKMDEKLSDAENQILTMMYAGALDLKPTAFAATAEAFGMSESELKNILAHLRELDMVDAEMKELTRKGIKYVVDLSKDGTFGG